MTFIQPRAVVCVSYAHTAVLSRRSVCIHSAMRNICCSETPNNTECVERSVLLFIYRLYIFTLLNMLVIILVNILYCSFISRPLVENHWPEERSTSIAFAIDLLGIPDPIDLVSHLYGSTVFADFNFIQTVWFFPHYFTSRCMPSMPPNFLIPFC